MDDLHRPPEDRDRDRLTARINRAHDEGRIGTADRDIRLGNVRSAQSMTELDLMNRDLDQLEATLNPTAPGAATGAPWSAFDPKAGVGSGEVAVSGSPRTMAIIISALVVLVLVAVGAVLVVGYQVSRSSSEVPSASPGVPVDPSSEDPAPGEPAGDSASDPAYALTATGIRAFLGAYRQRFGTSRVVDLTLYGDYAIVDVPVPGKARQTGWLYRNGAGWTSFGGTRATFPGSEIVDTNRLDIAGLVRNIALARRTLNVERPAQAYVIIRFIPRSEQVPSVDIHVVNEFRESGYLATTLEGEIERAYPYDR